MAGTSYRDLAVWRRSIDFAEAIYKVTADFPRDERYGLISQLRRASVSVPSNIAEGYGRNSPKSFQHFLQISMGSLKEIETQLTLSQRFGFLGHDIAERLLTEADGLSRMLYGLTRSRR